MFFVAKTEDCMWRMQASPAEHEKTERAFRRRVEKREQWLREFDKEGKLPAPLTVT